GEYELATVKPGFRNDKTTVTIGVKNVRADIRLRVGSLEETITIAGPRDVRPDVSTRPRVPNAAQPEPKACTPTATGGAIHQPTKIGDSRPIAQGKAGLVVLDALIGVD